MGKEPKEDKAVEVARLTPEMKAQIDSKRTSINPGAEMKPGYSQIISGFEETARVAREEANSLSKDAGQQADRENAGKGVGVDVSTGIGFKYDADGLRFGFVSPGKSKFDKFEDAVAKEEGAKEEIKSVKTLSNMGVKAEDVKALIDKGNSPSYIVSAIHGYKSEGKSTEEAVKEFKKDCDLSAMSDEAKEQAAQLAKNTFGEQQLQNKENGSTVKSDSPDIAAQSTVRTV